MGWQLDLREERAEERKNAAQRFSFTFYIGSWSLRLHREFRISSNPITIRQESNYHAMLPYKRRGCLLCVILSILDSQSITAPSIIFHFAIQFSNATLCVFCVWDSFKKKYKKCESLSRFSRRAGVHVSPLFSTSQLTTLMSC